MKLAKLSKLYKSKKAMDPNQIFIYIAAIVIVGFVFLYGFKAVATFINSSKEIELAKFVKDFKNSASSVSTDFGSTTYLSISIPSQFTKMCIVDVFSVDISGNMAKVPPATCPSELGQEVCDTWSDFYNDATLEKKNIFFLDAVNHVGYKDSIKEIELDYSTAGLASGVNVDGYLCTKSGRLKLDGGAQIATVSQADS